MRELKKNGVRLFYDVVRDGPPVEAAAVRMSSDIARVFRARQEARTIPTEREAFVVFLLNARHRVLALHVVSIGSLGSTHVHPREVFRIAVTAGAAAIVVAHNGVITERLRQAGELLGITVLDHVVIGSGSHYSFAEERTVAE